ncbi:hypothetical protein LTS08_003395 [Lithohypha guttulata]|nr:hypothetical protein LTS08_003395 [Lithohypha guttulata]
MTKSCEGFLWTNTGLSQGLDTEAAISSSKDIKSHYDVIVIGAGFAGLTSARELSRHHNLKVLIVEGRDRIGGRTWTSKALGEEFEMGGTWLHWNQPHVYHELYRHNLHKNLKTTAGTFAAEKIYYQQARAQVKQVDGLDLDTRVQNVAEKFFEIDGHNSKTLMPYPHDPFREPAPWKDYDHLTVRQRLDQIDLPALDKEYFETTVNAFGSAPGKDIGFVEVLRWYVLGGHTMVRVFEAAGTYKLGKGGMTTFARAILQDAKCDILLNNVVSEVLSNQRTGASTVKFHNGQHTVSAKVIVSTVPLNCLSDVKFTPELSALKREAIAQGHINKGAKIHFKLASTEPGWYAMSNGYGDSPYCFSWSDHNGTQVSGPSGTYCIGFGYNGHLENPRDNLTIIDQFKRNQRPDADVEAYVTHDWMNDPLAKGVWSCWGSNSMTKYQQELQKSHNHVFFASSDWADGWRGFVDGAIESGLKAANDVAAQLLPRVMDCNRQKL